MKLSKIVFFTMIIVCVAHVCFAQQGLSSRDIAKSLQDAFIQAASDVDKAVVSISTEYDEKVPVRTYRFRGNGAPFEDEFFDKFFKDFFESAPQREFKARGLGSGIIIDPEGYVLTNEHVVKRATKINVTLPDGQKFDAKVLGTDSRIDVALLKVDAHDLPWAKLGNSDDVKIGEWVIAIGNPFGYVLQNTEPTVTVGVVSALKRSLRESPEKTYTNLIQTDAAINPGNSGGPLVDIDGEVIGINVAIYTTSGGYQGIGFAIPINSAKRVIEQLKRGEKIQYGWLGVSIQKMTSELADYFGLEAPRGALVASVLENSPAEKAGIKSGDIIVRFDGVEIKTVEDLLDRVASAPVGKTVSVTVLRDKKPLELQVKIGNRPGEEEKTEESAQEPQQENEGVVTFRGMTVGPITPEIAEKLKMSTEKRSRSAEGRASESCR
jgi:serine protease Do